MDTNHIRLTLYEALTDAGVQPAAARQVERELESVLRAGHDAVRAEMRDQLLTKADGEILRSDIRTHATAATEKIRSDLLKALNEQTWKLFSAMLVFNGALLAVLKLL